MEQGQTQFPAGTSLWDSWSSASPSQSLSREMPLLPAVAPEACFSTLKEQVLEWKTGGRWASGHGRGPWWAAPVGGLELRLGQGESVARAPGGLPGGPGRGTHLVGGDVLPFTTWKRFCSSFSPQ